MVSPHDRTYDCAQREVGTDREVDPTGEDHQQLPERQDRDHGRLLEHVAEVVEREEHVRSQTQHQDQQRQDHDRTGLQRRQRDPQGPSGVHLDRMLGRSGAY